MSTSTHPKILLVVGATGSQGRPTLEHFAKQVNKGGFQTLRGLTRSASSESSKALAALGVQMVEGDLLDPASLKSAFEGVTHLFANTDSNVLIFQAISDPSLLKPGQTPLQRARVLEEEMGTNLENAAAACKTLQRMVWSSLVGPTKWSGGKYSKVSMFDAKQGIEDRLKARAELKGKLSVVLVGFYANNGYKMPQFYLPHKQSDGVYEFSLPTSGDLVVPISDTDYDMGKWVSALLLEAAPGTTLIGGSEFMSWNEWLALWADRNGVKGRYRKMPPEEFAQMMVGISDAVTEEFQFIEEYGFAGGNKDALNPEQLFKTQGVKITGTPISNHIQRTDWSKLL